MNDICKRQSKPGGLVPEGKAALMFEVTLITENANHKRYRGSLRSSSKRVPSNPSSNGVEFCPNNPCELPRRGRLSRELPGTTLDDSSLKEPAARRFTSTGHPDRSPGTQGVTSLGIFFGPTGRATSRSGRRTVHSRSTSYPLQSKDTRKVSVPRMSRSHPNPEGSEHPDRGSGFFPFPRSRGINPRSSARSLVSPGRIRFRKDYYPTG